VRVKTALIGGLLCLATFAPAEPGKEKEKAPEGKVVDSGSFGVFVNGRRVATETFSITENNNGSVATSRFKTESGIDSAEQSSELQLTAGGDLRRYEWKEISPGKSQAVVLPNETLLVERSILMPSRRNIRFFCRFLPASSMIISSYNGKSSRGNFWPWPATRKMAKCPVQWPKRRSLER